MDLHTRYCCDYEYENNMPKIDCDQPLMNQDTIEVNPYKLENINRNKLIELFDNNENDEIKKLLSMCWEWYNMNELLFEYCIDRNDMCKFILNHVQLSPEIIDEFLKYIVHEQKINYFELFVTHNTYFSRYPIIPYEIFLLCAYIIILRPIISFKRKLRILIILL